MERLHCSKVCLFQPSSNLKIRVVVLQEKYRGLSREDQAIAARLERLKESHRPEPAPSQAEIETRLQGLKGDRPPPPTEQEMAARLAQLKGNITFTQK